MESPSKPDYAYKALNTKSSIRLLSNLKLSITGTEISCTLEEVDLDEEPKYDCLSYTWGDPLFQEHLTEKRIYDIKNTVNIDCNGQILAIGENLYDFLVQFCKNPGGEGDLQTQDRIWIDAVCMNQGDDIEKSFQIQMMSRIYNDAQGVVVWLGPERAEDRLQTAISVMERLQEIPPEKLKTAVISDLDNIDTYENLSMKPISPEEWIFFAGFILRAWFSRMWVVQETFFAKKFIVFCGSTIIPWSLITHASLALKETSLGKLLNERMDSVTEAPSTQSGYIGNKISNQFIFTNLKDAVSSLSLERLLTYTRYFGATQAEDRVFAVLNMWKPEWERTPEDREIVKFIVRNKYPAKKKRADLDPKLANLPSWVPDFSAPAVWTPLASAQSAPGGKNRWNAAKGLKFKLPDTLPDETDPPNLSRLRVIGCPVDEIVHSAATDLELIDKHQMFTLLEVLSQYLESAKPSGTPTADRFEAFWKTLIKDTFLERPAGSQPEARKAFPMIITSFVWSLDADIKVLQKAFENPRNTAKVQDPRLLEFSDIYSRTKLLVDELAALENSIIPSWEVIQQTIKLGNEQGFLPEDLDKNLENSMASFNSAYQCRKLFRTKKNLLGISAQSLIPGDQVWVLAGAAVPMVLRLKNKKWEFVGEAYVHGIMNGEAVGPVEDIYLE
ncbi:hypothetical protein G7Y89_g2986 [Cudoniella acicularis]|uniref:Heterokaryon incompatibility domain-containing protein n=1 Tax=Cudoniella acicularis TaxID=354080 RepID=A0A8H4RS93_9HELO|nr:hypothetical protein G7Y89_g2986 [Cudoniella acicularis]